MLSGTVSGKGSRCLGKSPVCWGTRGKAVIRVSTAAQQRSLRSEAAGPCGLWEGLWPLPEMSVGVTEGLSRKVT